jgi:hypothetical protein
VSFVSPTTFSKKNSPGEELPALPLPVQVTVEIPKSPAAPRICRGGTSQPTRPANKKPRYLAAAGLKREIAEAYFFAKIYFESCDLWLEAALRWMTLLLTALSRAEL